MGLLERIFGRTKREHVADLIHIYETRVVPVMKNYVNGLEPNPKATAELVLDKVDRSILALIVEDTMNPPKPRKPDKKVFVVEAKEKTAS